MQKFAMIAFGALAAKLSVQQDNAEYVVDGINELRQMEKGPQELEKAYHAADQLQVDAMFEKWDLESQLRNHEWNDQGVNEAYAEAQDNLNVAAKDLQYAQEAMNSAQSEFDHAKYLYDEYRNQTQNLTEMVQNATTIYDQLYKEWYALSDQYWQARRQFNADASGLMEKVCHTSNDIDTMVALLDKQAFAEVEWVISNCTELNLNMRSKPGNYLFTAIVRANNTELFDLLVNLNETRFDNQTLAEVGPAGYNVFHQAAATGAWEAFQAAYNLTTEVFGEKLADDMLFNQQTNEGSTVIRQAIKRGQCDFAYDLYVWAEYDIPAVVNGVDQFEYEGATCPGVQMY